jgi:predicted transcriptional regulator with HTH domain
MIDTVWDAEVIFSLRRSKVRRDVLAYLVSVYPKYSYISEIARETELRINEVCGALNGSSNRYKKEISLVELGLVEKEEREGVWLYAATDAGKNAWRSFKN